MPPKSFTPATRHAAELLGARVKAGRLERGWSVNSLAERAQVSRVTIMNVERGDLRVALGTVFECATLVGVALFYEDEGRLAAEAARGRAPVLGKRARAAPPEVDLDF